MKGMVILITSLLFVVMTGCGSQVLSDTSTTPEKDDAKEAALEAEKAAIEAEIASIREDMSSIEAKSEADKLRIKEISAAIIHHVEVMSTFQEPAQHSNYDKLGAAKSILGKHVSVVQTLVNKIHKCKLDESTKMRMYTALNAGHAVIMRSFALNWELEGYQSDLKTDMAAAHAAAQEAIFDRPQPAQPLVSSSVY